MPDLPTQRLDEQPFTAAQTLPYLQGRNADTSLNCWHVPKAERVAMSIMRRFAIAMVLIFGVEALNA
jgi:hypothetical protein